MVALNVTDLSLGYENKLVLDKLSFQVKRGSFLSIIGENGSGKSTLLKGLCRLLKPQTGVIELFGEELTKLPTKSIAKQVAFLPQRPSYQSEITVERMVSYGREPHLSFRRRFNQTDQRAVDEAIEVTNLKHLRHRPTNQLSGGELQRTYLAMALAQEPEILFLDEPTSFLDLVHQLDILDRIKRLNQIKGLTVIMVNHDLNQAVRYSDTILALRNGEIAFIGEASQMMNLTCIERVFSVTGSIYSDLDHNCQFFIPKTHKGK